MTKEENLYIFLQGNKIWRKGVFNWNTQKFEQKNTFSSFVYFRIAVAVDWRGIYCFPTNLFFKKNKIKKKHWNERHPFLTQKMAVKSYYWDNKKHHNWNNKKYHYWVIWNIPQRNRSMIAKMLDQVLIQTNIDSIVFVAVAKNRV